MESIIAERTELDEKLLTLSAQIDLFEGYDAPHGKRIAAIADVLAAGFNLASRDRFFLQQAALLHDIGELAMNREYVRSPRVLSATERIDLQRHPVIGEQETAKLGLPRGVQLIVRWHHEWWNGSGYPDGLSGAAINDLVRMLTISDIFAALVENRGYKPPMPRKDAYDILVGMDGKLEQALVKAFRKAALER